MRVGLKMAGAKGPAMMAQILPLMPEREGWAVPFFGIGAAARAISERARIAWAGDANPRLVGLLGALRDDTDRLLVDAQGYADLLVGEGDADRQRERYYRLRARHNVTRGDHALFLVVWRTAFNGLMRVNARDDFNAGPRIQIGKPLRAVFDAEALREHGAWLRTIPRVLLADYAEAPEGPLYADPPYVDTTDAYHAGGFDHVRYHAWLGRRAGTWVASNSLAAREAYPEAYEGATVHGVSRSGRFSGYSAGRGAVGEILAVRP